MYTVNKGPSKLVAKTRGGLSQNFEKIETIREMSRKCAENGTYDLTEMNGPRPVFQPPRKTAHHNHHHNNHQYHNGRDHFGGIGATEDEEPSPQHEELVKFIRDSWNSVAAVPSLVDGAGVEECTTVTTTPAINLKHPYNNHQHNGNIKATSPPVSSARRLPVYHDEPPSPLLKDFGAFDLESWWGRRLFNNITKSL